MRIETDDLSRPQVHALLREHLDHMHALSPPEQVFALDLTQLRAPDITFWTLWENDDLLGCAALKALSAKHGEVKSMRTADPHRGRGAGRALLVCVVETARQRGYQKLSLEACTAALPEHGFQGLRLVRRLRGQRAQFVHGIGACESRPVRR